MAELRRRIDVLAAERREREENDLVGWEDC